MPPVARSSPSGPRKRPSTSDVYNDSALFGATLNDVLTSLASFERLGAPVYDLKLDFGGVCNGIADDIGPLNAAIAAVNAAPGILYLGPKLRISAPPIALTANNIEIRGRGSFNGGTDINVDFASPFDAVFTLNGQYGRVSNVRLNTNRIYTSGVGIKTAGYRCLVDRCRIDNLFNGIEVQGTLVIVDDCELGDLRGDYGIWVHGTAAGQTHATWINHLVCNTSKSTTITHVIHDSYAHTVRLIDCALLNGGRPLRVADSLGAGIDAPHFTRALNLECDHNVLGGIVLEAGEQAEFEQLFVTSVGGIGVDIQSSYHGDWRINGAFIFATAREGVRIAAPHGVLSNAIIAEASNGNPNVYDAIAVADGTTRFTIIGCSAGPSYHSAVPESRYGLSIGASCDHFIVEGNRFSGNITGGILNASGVSSSRVVRNNLPDSTPELNESVRWSKRVTFTATGAAGTLIDVPVYSANAPFALRIERAELRLTAAGGTAASLRTALAGGGSVILPDTGTPAQTFATVALGRRTDNANASAAVAANGTVILNIDRACSGEVILECVRQ